MSEPTTDIVEVKQFTSSVEKIKEHLPTIQRGSKVAMNLLAEIKKAKITSKEERDRVVAMLQDVKKIYDKVNKLRCEVTDPIDAAKDWIMAFERPFNYASKTDNDYNQAKAVIIAYDQKVLEDNKRAELEAERKRQVALYKAELKEKVARQLVEMLAGQQKNSIEGMARWEQGLTLGTIDQQELILKQRKPTLKQEMYDGCFKTEFIGKRTIITDEELVKWMEEFKKEFPYSKYQEEWAQIATPILNEYRSKMGAIKKRLEEIEKASEEKRIELENTRKEELSAKSQEAIKEVDKVTETKVEQIQQTTEMSKMDAEFTKQAQLQDLEEGPVKYEASFETAAWVQPFMTVIGHCIKSDKFKMQNTKGTALIDAIDWWLKFFSANCPKIEVTGIVWKEVPKTIIKGK